MGELRVRMQDDAFPSTWKTWIGQRLVIGDDGRAEVNAHVMTVYSHPLQVYFKGSSWRWLGDPEDIVQGFFADRLAREDFLSEWCSSGKPLRRWLVNAFSYYLMEFRRRRRKESRTVALGEDVGTSEGDPEAAFDRAFAVSVVREALRRAAKDCESEGLGQHWAIFLEHQYEERSYRELAEEFHVDPARAAVMNRTAAKRFRSAVRVLLARDGLAEEAIDGEVRSLLEVTSK